MNTNDYTDKKASVDISSLLKSSLIRVHSDGGIRPCNPGGAAGYAFSVSTSENPDVEVHSWRMASPPYPKNTVSVSEHYALFRALHWLWKNNLASRPIRIHCDSQFVVKQMSSNQKISRTAAYGWMARCSRYLIRTYFRNFEITWVPREENRRADYLADVALIDIGYKKRTEGGTCEDPTGEEEDHGHFQECKDLASFLLAEKLVL